MPYKDRLKRQQAWRESQRKHRGSTPSTPVNPDKQEKLAELRQMVAVIKAVKPVAQVPLYNSMLHKAGDTVRMLDGQVLVIPELDADGQLVPLQSISSGINLVSSNLFKSSYSPAPKPEPKKRKYAIK